MFDIIIQAKKLYERIERFNPFVFFFGGFTWDSVTLRRIDQLLDNIVLLFYIIAFGVLMSISLLVDRQKLTHPFIKKHEKWFPLGLQFFLGGLFSAYVIFYFQSASFTRSGVFLILLVALLIANEFLENKLRNLYLLLILYFLASFSFFIFFIPVLLKVLNILTFIAGGLLSLGLVVGLSCFFYKKLIFNSRKHFIRAVSAILAVYGVMNLLYFLNWIPPVPLSLRTSGIYHHASRVADDRFQLQFEKPKWYQFYRTSDKEFHYASGDTVFCFTAVFAPTELKKKIVHHWQVYSTDREEWLSTDRLGFQIIGYRDGGYRGITRKQNVSPGQWRVDVETDEGVLLGRLWFDIASAEEARPLKTIYR